MECKTIQSIGLASSPVVLHKTLDSGSLSRLWVAISDTSLETQAIKSRGRGRVFRLCALEASVRDSRASCTLAAFARLQLRVRLQRSEVK